MAWEPMRLSDAIGSELQITFFIAIIWVTDMSEARLLADHMHLPPVVPFPCPSLCAASFKCGAGVHILPLSTCGKSFIDKLPQLLFKLILRLS